MLPAPPSFPLLQSFFFYLTMLSFNLQLLICFCHNSVFPAPLAYLCTGCVLTNHGLLASGVLFDQWFQITFAPLHTCSNTALSVRCLSLLFKLKHANSALPLWFPAVPMWPKLWCSSTAAPRMLRCISDQLGDGPQNTFSSYTMYVYFSINNACNNCSTHKAESQRERERKEALGHWEAKESIARAET